MRLAASLSVQMRRMIRLFDGEPMKEKKDTKKRCSWAETDSLLKQYHDEEWGVPEYDSRTLWELLMLEGFQAGLSWITVLRKREAFRKAFRRFDPAKVARFTEADVQRLLADAGINSAREDLALEAAFWAR